MTKHRFYGFSIRSQINNEKKKRKDQEFNLSVRCGDNAEFEANVLVIQDAGILILPIDSEREDIYIRNSKIKSYEDNAGVDIILLDIIYHSVPTVTFRFPSHQRKSAFIDLIRPISDDDSGLSTPTGTSSEFPSPPQDPPQD